MRILIATTLVSSLVLSGCSGWRDSRVNPSNWFGGSSSQPTETTDANPNPLIGESRGGLFGGNRIETYEGTPVDQVTGLRLERTASGAIIHVAARSARQGAYDVRLVSETDGEPVDGELVLTLKAMQPQNMRQGPASTRLINAARYVSNPELERIRTIRVIAARNTRTINRR